MENDFKHFIKCLSEACRKIDRHYFQLDVAGSMDSVFRERVYCYELYHQLRCVLGDSFPYKLDGEVDKAGHPIIRKTLGRKKPDFIVHVPSGMQKNLVVIEVKPITVKDRPQKLKKDLETLRGFLNLEDGYYRAIMLIYGNGDSNSFQKIHDEVESFDDKRISLVWHRDAGEKPELINQAVH